jgi:hypothetical protein
MSRLYITVLRIPNLIRNLKTIREREVKENAIEHSTPSFKLLLITHY